MIKMTDEMKKKMIKMLIYVGILFAAIFLYKFVMEMFGMWAMKKYGNPTATVSAMKAGYSSWSSQLEAVGSLRTTQGVNVTTELAGMVETIYFTSGSFVKKGTLLVQLDIAPDVAQLHSLQAAAKLAAITYTRDKAQYTIGAVSKQTLDTDQANLDSDNAQVVEQIANIAKKTIRAPFTGRLGINMVYPGQYLNPGSSIVILEKLDPIYVDFYLPQEVISHAQVGQTVNMTVDTFGSKNFTGKVTTVNPEVDTNTRNVWVEATLPNANDQLLPGMFTTVNVTTGAPQSYLTLPQTAVNFNSYGDVVYVLQPFDKKDEKGDALWKATQTFVTTGATRGDQIVVLKGIKAGDMVVTSGQLKLKNGSIVKIDNSVVPSDSANPSVATEE